MYPNYIIENDRRNTFSEVFGKISSERLSHAGFFHGMHFESITDKSHRKNQ